MANRIDHHHGHCAMPELNGAASLAGELTAARGRVWIFCQPAASRYDLIQAPEAAARAQSPAAPTQLPDPRRRALRCVTLP